LQPCGHGLGLMAEDVSGVSEVSVFPIRHLCLFFFGMRGLGCVCRFGGGGGPLVQRGVYPQGSGLRNSTPAAHDPFFCTVPVAVTV
jgi:hypothetical protein